MKTVLSYLAQFAGFYLLSLVFLTACQTVHISIPAPGIDTPEIVHTHDHFLFQGGVKSGAVFKLVENAAIRPPVFSEHSLDPGLMLYWDMGLPLAQDKILIKAFLMMADFSWPGLGLRGQYQFYGKNQNESAPGDYSASVYADIFSTSMERSGDQEYLFGPGHRYWKAKAHAQGSSFSAAMGYRLTKRSLVYFGGGYGIFSTEGSIHQDATDTNPEANYDIEKKSGNTTTAALGYTLRAGPTILDFKVTYSQFVIDRYVMRVGGADVSISFGGAKLQSEPAVMPIYVDEK